MQMASIEPSRQVLLALFEVFEACNRPASAAQLLRSCQVWLPADLLPSACRPFCCWSAGRSLQTLLSDEAWLLRLLARLGVGETHAPEILAAMYIWLRPQEIGGSAALLSNMEGVCVLKQHAI